jgi:predicted 2-oxoglutarate/Fe(II)-dependent dioxygenase YbiX
MESQVHPYRSIPFGPSTRNELFWIYVSHCLTRSECEWLVSEADAHGDWTTQRHKSAPTTDMEVLKVPTLRDWLQERSRRVIFPTLAACYGFHASELHYMDLFLVRYDAEASGAQRGLMAHRDRSLLSFNILLSDPSAFDGGGTCFDVLDGQAVRPSHIGDLTMHPGKARHAGVAVCRGVRHILVGFVGVRSPRVDHKFLQACAQPPASCRKR